MPAPGATSAFKVKPLAKQPIIPAATGKAPAAAPTATPGVKIAVPTLAAMATSNPALGGMFGLLFGRVMNNVPGLKNMLSNPVLRDITLGAAVAAMVEKLKQEEHGEDPYNPRPTDQAQQNGWNLL
jgi:hypothetical protein